MKKSSHSDSVSFESSNEGHKNKSYQLSENGK